MNATTMNAVIVLFIFGLFFQYSFAAGDPRCKGVPPGEAYLFPYPGDCTKYVECTVDRQTIVQVCANGNYFNEALQSCDHPDLSGCVPLTCPPGVVDYYSYPGDCSRYVECYRGQTEIHSCPGDLHFNPVEKRCLSAPLSGCGQYSPTPAYTWTPPPFEACWGVLPNVIELKAIPGTCVMFLECTGSQGVVLSCPPGLQFNAKRQMCDQSSLSDCDASTATPGYTTSLAPVTAEGYDDPRCANGNSGYWEFPDCSKFIECYEGHGYLVDCPSGLYFSPDKLICEDPKLSVCGRITAPPNPHSTLPSNPDPDCPYPSPLRYLFPFPGDCTKFMECVDAQKVVQVCPAGLWFNPTLMVCDYPYEAGCRYGYLGE